MKPIPERTTEAVDLEIRALLRDPVPTLPPVARQRLAAKVATAMTSPRPPHARMRLPWLLIPSLAAAGALAVVAIVYEGQADLSATAPADPVLPSESTVSSIVSSPIVSSVPSADPTSSSSPSSASGSSASPSSASCPSGVAPAPAARVASIGEAVRVWGELEIRDVVQGVARARNKAEIVNGAVLSTASKGFAEVLLQERSRVFLEDASTAALTGYGTALQVRLDRGAVIVHADERRPSEQLEVEAAGYRVSVRGTRFRVERGDAWVRVEVERGAVQIDGPGLPPEGRRLEAHQGVTLGGAPTTPPVQALSEQAADWVRDPSPVALSPRNDGHAPVAKSSPPALPGLVDATPELAIEGGQGELERPSEAKADPYEQARALFFAHQYAQAAALLAGWLQQPGSPPNSRARLLWADALRLAGDEQAAMQLYSELAVEQTSATQSAIFELIGLLEKAEDKTRAIWLCGDYEQRYPDGLFAAEVRHTHATLLASLGRFQEGWAVLEPALVGSLSSSERVRLTELAVKLAVSARDCHLASELQSRSGVLSAVAQAAFASLLQHCGLASDDR